MLKPLTMFYRVIPRCVIFFFFLVNNQFILCLKRKCKVESSTDSESDNNNDEGFGIEVSIPTFPVDVKSMDFQKLQFLDPYDGDSEDTIQSSSSECDQKCARGGDPDPSTLRDDSMSVVYGLIPTGDTEGECWGHVPCTDPMERMKTSWQSLDLSERPDNSVVSVHTCCDLDMDSDMVSEDASVSSGRFLLFGLDSRVETSPLSPTNLMSEENSDFSILGASLMKRKWIRTEGEKARRKKPRVSGYMT
ncbi:uncharacterized protein [Ranitomeya imitator]|uniref:uncharacterized protein isoform X1 n=1 Tax=Ranitomeya imitator TaxID=111125 RepID=UPI0037E9AB56